MTGRVGMIGRFGKAGIVALGCSAGAGGLALALAAAVPVAHPRQSASSAPGAGQPAVSLRVTSPTPVLAYYYLWFNHSSWNRAKKDYPLIGTYSSGDPSVMRHQIRQAKSAGIDGFIVSWKNTSLNNQRLRLLMTVASQQHFKLAMIYQGLNFYRHPLPVSEVAADFTTFRDKFASDPVFLRLNGKPLTIWSGTCRATILRRQPGPRSKKKRLSLPSSTMIAVPACARVGGTGELPTNEILISSEPRSSIPGKNVLAFATDGVGR